MLAEIEEVIGMEIDELGSRLKDRYEIMLGEKSLGDLKDKLYKMLDRKIKVSGRSFRTGLKITVDVSIKDLV